jgi:hypothetical protein
MSKADRTLSDSNIFKYFLHYRWSCLTECLQQVPLKKIMDEGWSFDELMTGVRAQGRGDYKI